MNARMVPRMTDPDRALILEALRAAHHELTVVNGCTATDLKRGTASPGAGTAWRVDASATLAKIERAMEAMKS